MRTLGSWAGLPSAALGKEVTSAPDRGRAELLKRPLQRNPASQQSIGTAVRAAGATGRVGGGRDRSVTATCTVHPGQLCDLSERHFCPFFLPTVLNIQ